MTTSFFDTPVKISRFDRLKHPWMRKLTRKQMGFFWQAEEVELSIDSKDFKSFGPEHQHIFTSNLQRQILLDSKQGSAPSEALGCLVSIPELRNFIKCWEFFEENIHSWSYQYIIENLYPNASTVFDGMDTIDEIVQCREAIDKYYDELEEWNFYRQAYQRGIWKNYDEFEHKRALWMCLHAINFLEGIRFYVSFACSWAFAELKKMEGNAKIIKFICRDENIHLAFTQQLIRALPKEDPDFARIKEEQKVLVEQLVKEVSNQEKDWAKFLMKKGPMLGLNEQGLCDFTDYRSYKCATALGIYYEPKVKDNPLPWTGKWIGGSEVQVAPQETQQTQYIVGDLLNDIDENTFKGFTL